MAARRCPTCGGPLDRAPEESLPFCSPTCKLADLGRWLDGSYRIPGPMLEIENDSQEIASPAKAEDP